jgi:hypothetical protein
MSASCGSGTTTWGRPSVLFVRVSLCRFDRGLGVFVISRAAAHMMRAYMGTKRWPQLSTEGYPQVTDEDRGAAEVTDDIDDIEVRMVDPVPAIRLRPAARGSTTPIFVPSKSTPLEEENADAQIPSSALWAMKYRRHLRFGRRADDFFRVVLSESTDPIYVLDDGASHRMIGREVGVDEVGLTYYLIGRITLDAYEQFVPDGADVADIFSVAGDLSLCSVYEAPDAVSNVLLVEDYRGIDDVPADYLPLNPLITFSDEPGEG